MATSKANGDMDGWPGRTSNLRRNEGTIGIERINETVFEVLRSSADWTATLDL